MRSKQLIRLIFLLLALFVFSPKALAGPDTVFPPCPDWKGQAVVELPSQEKIYYSIFSTTVRVLNADPLVVEALADSQLVEKNFDPNDPPRKIPIPAGEHMQLPLTVDVAAQRAEYTFDDIAVVNTYHPLGCGERMTWSKGDHRPVIVAMNKIQDTSGLYRQLGTLLRFGTPGGGILRLHENGQVAYLVGPNQDMRIDNEFISPRRIQQVRATMASANMQCLPPAHFNFRHQDQRSHRYFLMAADTELCIVQFDQAPARFQPLLQELEQIIGELAPKFTYRIFVEKKVATNVFKWTPREIALEHLAEVQERKIEWWDKTQWTRYTKQYTDMFAKLFKPLPAEILNVYNQTRKQGRDTFLALDGPYLYEVSGNGNPNALAAAGDNTYGALAVTRVPTNPNETKWREWPAYVGIRPADIPPEGLNIGLREYQDHASFYDTLDAASHFIEGDYEYRGFRIERVNSSSTPGPKSESGR